MMNNQSIQSSDGNDERGHRITINHSPEIRITVTFSTVINPVDPSAIVIEHGCESIIPYDNMKSFNRYKTVSRCSNCGKKLKDQNGTCPGCGIDTTKEENVTTTKEEVIELYDIMAVVFIGIVLVLTLLHLRSARDRLHSSKLLW